VAVVTDTIGVGTAGFADVVDLTPKVERVVNSSGVREGVVVVANPGSTASITTIEFEPGLVDDLKRAAERLAPTDEVYKHDRRWGDGNGHSHVRAAVFGPSVALPLRGGRLQVGAWQQVVLVDFDNRPRSREVIITVVGE
jgi:secondary thiamine-phosphate synthase enzyme